MEVVTSDLRRIAFMFQHASFNPADATTYFIGQMGGVIPTTASNARFRIPALASGVIDYARLTGNYSTGSNESVTLAIHNVTAGTSVQLTTSFNMSSITSVPAVYTSIGLAVTSGDELEFRMVCPTWATTNPTAVVLTLNGYITMY